MLKHDEARFLDDRTVDELAHQLKTPIRVVQDLDDLLTCCVDLQSFAESCGNPD